MEDAPVGGYYNWDFCVCHGHKVLFFLSSAGTRLVEAESVRGVCGCAPILAKGMALRPEECNKLSRPSFA
jgi:hypothetical protein